MSYKLAGEDEHTFHIQHPDGSVFPIAKHAISPGVHKKIKGLAPIKMANGGEVPDNRLTDYSQISEEKPAATIDSTPALNQNGLLIDSAPEYREPAASPNQGLVIDQLPDANQSPAAPQSIPVRTPATSESTTTPDTSVASDPFAAANLEQSKALGAEQDINAKTANAVSSGLTSMAQAQNDLQSSLKANEVHYAPIEQDLTAKNQQLSKAIMDQKIDHNRLFNTMGTGNKILAAFSIALGGIGAGLTGGPNAALGVIDKSIDRDIESQKMELGKKQTLFSENLRQLGDARAAKAATASQLITAAQAKGNMIAAQNGSAETLGRMQILNKELDLKRISLNREAAINSFIYKNKDSNPEAAISILRRTDPQRAKEMEGRYVPGVGMASIPVPDQTRQNLIAKQALGERARDLYKWSEQNSGNLNPKTVAEGKTKAAELQSLYRAGINGGVFKAGEQSFIENIVHSDPTAFFNKIRVLPALKEVISSNESQLNGLKKAYGLSPSAPEPETKISNGIKYMRGPNGQAIPVK